MHKKKIHDIVAEAEVGQTYTGKVTRIMNFGAFVEILPGKEGLLHISHIAHERVSKVEDVLNIGDEVEVKVTFPEDYQAADLAGKAAVFVTKVNEVKAKEVPALDDELAKDLDDEVETLDELKAKYRKELEAAKEIAYDDAVEGAAL